MTGFKIWLGQSLCNFGLWVLSLGPKDAEDARMYRDLIQAWRKFQVMKVNAQDKAFLEAVESRLKAAAQSREEHAQSCVFQARLDGGVTTACGPACPTRKSNQVCAKCGGTGEVGNDAVDVSDYFLVPCSKCKGKVRSHQGVKR